MTERSRPAVSPLGSPPSQSARLPANALGARYRPHVDAETLKLVFAGVVTLVVNVLVFQLQQGGRRRRRRSEIQAELELLGARTAPRYDEWRQRVEARVAVLLRRYEPRSSADQVENQAPWWAHTLFLLAVGILLWLFNSRMQDLSLGSAALIGISLGLVGAATVTSLLLARDRHRQDEEVRELVARHVRKELRWHTDDYVVTEEDLSAGFFKLKLSAIPFPGSLTAHWGVLSQPSSEYEVSDEGVITWPLEAYVPAGDNFRFQYQGADPSAAVWLQPGTHRN